MFINNIYGGIMSGRRYGLREDQWEKIKDLVPGREGLIGATGKDNRLFIEAVIYRYRSGIPWRDLPERFGDWNNIARRHKRWSDKGFWQKIFEQLSIESDDEYAAIDGTIVRVHQDASGAKKGVKNPNV
jgi:transposase